MAADSPHSTTTATDEFHEVRRYLLWTGAAFLLLTLAGWYVIDRYETQRIDALLHSENAKLLAVQEMARIRQDEGLRTHNRLLAKLQRLLAGPALAEGGNLPESDIERIYHDFEVAYDSTPEFKSIELYDARGRFLLGSQQIKSDTVLPSFERLAAPRSQHVAARASSDKPILRVYTAELERINGRLPDTPEPSMYTTSWVTGENGAPLFLLVMQYALSDIYHWADRVVGDYPRVDHYRIAADGMFLIGGERFEAFEFAANRGMSGRKLEDVLPTVWSSVARQRYGGVETPDGMYLFRSHASNEALHVARNSAYATSILFLPTTTLYATSIFAGFQGLALIIVIYLTAGWIAWGFWRQLLSRRAIEAKDAEISTSLARFEDVTRFGRLGLLEINTVTGDVYANPAFFEMHGKPVPEEGSRLKTRDIRLMFHGYESLQERHAAAIARLVQGDEKQVFDYDFKLTSGEFRRYRVMVSLTTGDDQQPRSRTLFTDITDLYQQQQTLLRAGEQQAGMFKIIAHELRTPAAAAQMIVDELPDSLPEKTELLSTSEHLMQVIDDLRITVNPDTLIDSKPVHFSLAVLLEEVERQVRALFVASNMSLELAFVDPEQDSYFADAFRLRAILTNLLRNAAYHSAGSRAWLSVDVTPLEGGHDRLMIRVDDDGRGISGDSIERLFSAFERGDTHVGGTGVGLYIARSWSELLGGALSYRHSEFGGACFELTLTLERSNGATIEASQQSSLPQRVGDWVSGKRLLLVEDDMLLQKATERMLTREYGMTVEVAEDGVKGLRAVENGGIDLIITDFLMPNMDGREMIAAIRRAGYDLPIIALTAATIGDEQDALKAAGATAVLPKPLVREKFEAALETIIPVA